MASGLLDTSMKLASFTLFAQRKRAERRVITRCGFYIDPTVKAVQRA